ncbi:MAG: hypothetical protein EOM87_02140 [Clostridia bacterium]|nr:hypothetical protein [Clostridia bacterium]
MKKIAESKLFAAICLAFGLVALASVVIQIFFSNLLFPSSFEFGEALGGVNILAYFTILSNIFVGLWLVIFAVYKLFNAKILSFIADPLLQGAFTLYIFVTGVVYFGILTFIMDLDFEATALFGVINYINHLIMPLFFTAIWFLPISDKRITHKGALLWLTFPLLYFVFSMIRGALTSFYPYPFLSPILLGQIWNFLNGYFLVGVAFVLLLGFFTLLSRLFVYLRNRFVIA